MAEPALRSASRRHLLLAAAAGALLAGCGFRPRGIAGLGAPTVHINTARNSALGRVIERRLSGSETRWVEPTEAAEIRLDILSYREERDILSLTPDGKVREYQIRAQLRFRALDKEGEEIVPATTLTAERDYGYSDDEVTAREKEEVLLYADMRQQLVDQMFLMIGRTLAKRK
ncbi:LPS assembly lipoprotein LptE [Tepidiphilus baoligensis]|uniref:LPS-assembly lipoprotein LptE n=1 Tax=Tepidiphilus baoligensis TaxID=2698687 RepID=A0ABX1QLP4_9PROT|nr:LPS assembly lipoprotein LptE [Tepidiphilus baoligensis]NMH16617.1 hypothetical protein [Tepidiphilus baoligensis]